MAREPRKICQICKRPASSITEERPEGPVIVGYVHIDRPSDGHEIVAVSEDEIDYDDIDQICDFCSSPDVEWVFETKPTFRPEDVGGMAVRDTAWAACEVCRAFIEDTKPDAKALANHVISIHVGNGKFPELLRPMLVDRMIPLYDLFIRNKTGEVIPVREYFTR